MSTPSIPLKLNPAPNFFSEYSILLSASLKDVYTMLGTSAGHERVCRLFKGCTAVELLDKDEIVLPIPNYPHGMQLVDIAVRTADSSDGQIAVRKSDATSITRQHFTMVETIPLVFGFFSSKVMLKGTMSWDDVALSALSGPLESGAMPSEENTTLYALYETIGNMGIMVWKLRIFTRDESDPLKVKVTERIEGWAPAWLRLIVQRETTKGHRVPDIDAELYALRSPLVNSRVKIGIGLFYRDSEFVSNKVIRVPEWTLILHPTDYRSTERTIHGIFKALDPNADAKSIENRDNWTWMLRDPKCPQTDLSDPIGIIHVADFPWSHQLLQAVIEKRFEAEKNGDNPGGVTVWSSSAWTIRVLHYLQEWYGQDTGFRLPCSTRRLHELIRAKIVVLKITKHRRKKVPVIDLF